MYRHLPNSLTLFRLVLAGFYFLILNQYRYPDGPEWALWVSVVLFVMAGLTDWLDGYLARKWHVETVFGRVMDPFCDKVLVIGAFIYLSGPRFVDLAVVQSGKFQTMVSGIYPWMIALMLARELLVTGFRGEMEDRGVAFGAQFSGKLKTIVQLVAIPVVIGIVALDPSDHRWMAITRDLLVYTTVLVTVVSGLPYVASAARSMRQD